MSKSESALLKLKELHILFHTYLLIVQEVLIKNEFAKLPIIKLPIFSGNPLDGHNLGMVLLIQFI